MCEIPEFVTAGVECRAHHFFDYLFVILPEFSHQFPEKIVTAAEPLQILESFYIQCQSIDDDGPGLRGRQSCDFPVCILQHLIDGIEECARLNRFMQEGTHAGILACLSGDGRNAVQHEYKRCQQVIALGEPVQFQDLETGYLSQVRRYDGDIEVLTVQGIEQPGAAFDAKYLMTDLLQDGPELSSFGGVLFRQENTQGTVRLFYLVMVHQVDNLGGIPTGSADVIDRAVQQSLVDRGKEQLDVSGLFQPIRQGIWIQRPHIDQVEVLQLRLGSD